MKTCPNCQASNASDAKFCEQCGYRFSNVETTEQKVSEENKSSIGERSKKNQPNKLPYIVSGIVVLLIFIGGGIFLATRRNNSSAPTATNNSSTNSSTEISSTQESSSELSKYDDTIRKAKELTISGDYQESALLLASIPVSDLAKSEFAAIKDAVEELTKQNEKGMEKNESEEADNNSTDTTQQSGFTGENAKWANTYAFYHSQPSQIQSTLRISANGGVTQTNYDGTQFFGQATIVTESNDALSYTTDEYFPLDQPSTKMIHSDIKITVTWDNSGGVQTYYGYLSYSSRLVLTDGVTKGSGVNEVWITY